MKKILLFTAALVLVSVGLLSCNKNNSGNAEPAKEEAKLEEPEFANDAVTIEFTAPEETSEEDLIEIDGYKVAPKKLIFTESGRYVFIGVVRGFTKADLGIGDIFTKTGEYTKESDGSYKMPGIGSVSTGSTPSGQGSTTQTQATITDESGNETTYENTTVTDAAPASGENEKNMVRSWVPEGKVHVEVPSKGISTNVEPSLEAIAKYLKEHEMNVDVNAYMGYDIADITMSLADKSFIVAFKNQNAYVGEWRWTNESKGEFAYNFNSDMAGELISGNASGSVNFYSVNNVNKCDFVMSVTAKDITGKLNFTLKEK